MRLRVIAPGHRMPGWVAEGWAEYVRRLPREFAVELVELRPEPRDRGRTTGQILAAEGVRIAREWAGDWVRIALDERGRGWTTTDFASRLRGWRDQGRAVAFAIGSADGLAESVRRDANVILSLSALTLPHGLVRVMLAEQIYRAASLLAGHPYHRE
jgi:23S rRNA (pseudouridine1915-N3)-methyltransferase